MTSPHIWIPIAEILETEQGMWTYLASMSFKILYCRVDLGRLYEEILTIHSRLEIIRSLQSKPRKSTRVI